MTDMKHIIPPQLAENIASRAKSDFYAIEDTIEDTAMDLTLFSYSDDEEEEEEALATCDIYSDAMYRLYLRELAERLGYHIELTRKR